MKDQKTTIYELKSKFRKFAQDRDWEKFHTAKNLSMNLAIEAAELMEHFTWVSEEDLFKTLYYWTCISFKA